MKREALSDVEGQVSLFPSGCSLGICLSPAALCCSSLVQSRGIWSGFLKAFQGAFGDREVIQGGIHTSQELTRGVASPAGWHWLPESESSAAVGDQAVVPIGAWELALNVQFSVWI